MKNIFNIIFKKKPELIKEIPEKNIVFEKISLDKNNILKHIKIIKINNSLKDIL